MSPRFGKASIESKAGATVVDIAGATVVVVAGATVVVVVGLRPNAETVSGVSVDVTARPFDF